MQAHASGPDGRQRRFLIAAGTARYDHLAEEDWLGSVPGDLERLVGLFCGQLGYTQVLAELGDNPTSQQLRGTLSAWLTDPARRPDDLVVVYYSGHGVTRGRHYLLTRDSEEDSPAGTALATEDLAWILGDSQVQQLLVIIDTCYAGRGVQDLGRVAAQLAEVRVEAETAGSGLWFLAAARPRDEADEGVFAEALVAAVSRPKTGLTQPYVSLDTLVSEVNEVFAQRALAQRARVGAADAGGQAPFIPNLGYDPGAPVDLDVESLARLRQVREDFTAHWLPRARGVALASDPGWYFSGRTRILRELVGWLSDPDADHRARVVTGGPGSGKSAVLARLVTLADPQTRTDAPLQQAPAGTIPPEGGIDVAVHARNKTLAEVVAALAARIGAHAATPEELLKRLEARPRRRVVVIDALDEASAPEELTDRLLRPLLDQAPRSGLRLLVGTRWPLVRALGPRTVVIDLDDPAYLELGDLAGYVTQVLLAEQEREVATPYRGRRERAEQVAWAVARRASPTFLIARLVGRSLVTADEVVDASAAGWHERLPATVGHAFDAYLERFGADEQRVRDLLTPLAWAEGAGLPWEQLWAPLARALAGNDHYSDDDIGWLQRAAGAYLVESREGGRSVYRLYHQALAEHLRDQTRQTELQGRLAQTLIACTPTGADGRPDWLATHPYIRTHLATHAAAGERLDELLDDARFLLAADPDRLLRALPHTTTPRGGLAAAVYKGSVHQLRTRPLGQAAAYLEMTARQYGADNLADSVAHLPIGVPWSTRWARWRPVQPHRLAGRHDGRVLAVAVAELEGRRVIVSVGSDATVRVWDVARGTPVGRPLTLHGEEWVSAVAVAELNGRPVVVTGGGTVRVWDVARGTPVGRPLTLPVEEEWVSAVAVAELNGRPVVVTGGGTLRVWDLARGTPVGEPLKPRGSLRSLPRRDDRRAAVSCLAIGKLEGRPVVVAGGWDWTVGVWDLARGRPVGGPFTGHHGGVSAVAVAELEGRPVIVTGDLGGRVRVWDLAAGTPVGEPLTGHHGGVSAVAVGELNGRSVIVTGGWDWTVRVWDLAAGTPVGEPLTGHQGEIRAVAVAELEGRPVVVTGDLGGRVRVWDLAAGTPVGEPLTGHHGEIRAVAVAELEGRPVVVTGDLGGRVRVWDLAAGTPVGQPFTHHGGGAGAVAVAELEGRPVVVTGGGTLRVWDLAAGTPVGEPLTHRGVVVSAVAVGELNGRSVVVTGDLGGAGRVWDLAAGTPVGEPLTRHHGVVVSAVAVGELNGHSVIVTVGSDGRVGVWDLARGTPVGGPLGHQGGIRAVTVAELEGRPVVVTGGWDGRVRVWDLAGGIPVGGPLTGHQGGVRAVTVGELNGRPVIVSGGDDGTVRIWEETGRLRQMIEVGSGIDALVLVQGGCIIGGTMGVMSLSLKPSQYRS
jgi:WD40 repeat protein